MVLHMHYMTNISVQLLLLFLFSLLFQWPFQEPKLEVPTIYKAKFFRAMSGNIPTKYGLIWY